MAVGITLEIAQSNLDSALAALAAARLAQSTQVAAQSGGRRTDRASHDSLLKEVQYWEQKVAALSRRGGLSSWSAVPQ